MYQVAFHVFRIADEGRAVYAGGLRVRADHRRQGYPAILSSNSESIVKDITRLWGRQPIVGRLTVAESPWITDYIAKNPTRNVVDRRVRKFNMVWVMWKHKTVVIKVIV